MRRSPFRLLALAALALPACDSDDPGADSDPGDLEFITNVVVTLTPDDGGDAVELEAVDENGDGLDIEYVPARAVLDAGRTYTGAVRLLDERNDVNVTEDIEAEADRHLFRFDFTGVSGLDSLSVVATDSESDYLEEDQGFEDYAVGLRFDLETPEDAAGTGSFVVRLYHFEEGDDKESSFDTSDETDVELFFPIEIAD